MVPGRLDDSPAMMRLTKNPIECIIAEFWKVVIIPDPEPRASPGRLFITSARFGEENMPMPIPFSSRIAANAQ